MAARRVAFGNRTAIRRAGRATPGVAKPASTTPTAPAWTDSAFFVVDHPGTASSRCDRAPSSNTGFCERNEIVPLLLCPTPASTPEFVLGGYTYHNRPEHCARVAQIVGLDACMGG